MCHCSEESEKWLFPEEEMVGAPALRREKGVHIAHNFNRVGRAAHAA
jgi:hypothetical protein